MVGYNSDTKKKFSQIQSAFAGGAAGAVTRALGQPLDVLKIRFQLQVEPIRAGSKYSSIFQAVTSIVKEEGVFAFWSGHVPAQLLSISYGVVQFSTFESLTEFIYKSQPNMAMKYKHSTNFACGALAACAATVISFPFDTVRTRLIAEAKSQRVYTGVINTFVIMARTEGYSALFKGLLPTIAQIAPHAGIQFAIYKLFTDNILNRITFFQRTTSMSKAVELTLIANLIAGSVAGLVAKVGIYPFDLVKKRLQVQGFQEYRQSFGKQIFCNGFFDCIKVTIKYEGVLGLYKGLGPSLYKAAFASAFHFAVYDEIKHFLRINV